MAMLDLNKLPRAGSALKGGKKGKSNHCIETAGVDDVVRNDDVVTVSYRDGEKEIEIPCADDALAHMVYDELVRVIRMIHADRVRIGEIPGFEDAENGRKIIKKDAIELIHLYNDGVGWHVKFTHASGEIWDQYTGRKMAENEIEGTQALLDAIFCS